MSFSKGSSPPRDPTPFSCIAGRLSQRCHRTISSSVAPFSSCPQFFPTLGSFPVSWLLESGGQSIGASASVLPMNIWGWFLLWLTGLISLLSKGLSRVFSSTSVQKHQFFSTQLSLWSNSHIHTWQLEKPFVIVVQSLRCVQLFAIPWTAAHQAFLSFTISQHLLKFMSIGLVMPFNHLILCCPLLLLSIFPSIRFFASELAFCIRWPKYCSFSFSISPSNEYSGLIFLRIDCFDLFAVQGTLKSLLQHHVSKASILLCSAFFIVQLSHAYMTTGKAIALTIWTFVNRVLPLLFNTLSRFIIAFLPRSKHLLISWPQSPSTAILEPKKIRCHCFHFFPIYLPWVDGTGCHDLRFLNAEGCIFFF